jgi:hypothetical protein
MAKFTESTIRRLLSTELAEPCQRYGFTTHGDDRFFRSSGDREDAFGFGISRSLSSFCLDLHIRVCFLRLEKLLACYFPRYSGSSGGPWNSSDSSHGMLTYKVGSLEDLSLWAAMFPSDLVEKVLPWIAVRESPGKIFGGEERFALEMRRVVGLFLDGERDAFDAVVPLALARHRDLLLSYRSRNPLAEAERERLKANPDAWELRWPEVLVADLRGGVVRDVTVDGVHPEMPDELLSEWQGGPEGPVRDPYVDMLRSMVTIPKRESLRVVTDVVTEPSVEVTVAAVREVVSEPEDLEPEEFVEVRLSGFDVDGEPSVRLFEDGSLVVVFEFMPPSSWEMDLEDAQSFLGEFCEAVGVDGYWDDTEFLVVENPGPDTVDRIRVFIENYRDAHAD